VHHNSAHSAADNGPWTSILDIYHPDPMTCTSGCYYSF